MKKFIKIHKDPLPFFSISNVVYKIEYKDCHVTYIGQLKTRIAEHRYHIRWNSSTRSIITHCAQKNLIGSMMSELRFTVWTSYGNTSKSIKIFSLISQKTTWCIRSCAEIVKLLILDKRADNRRQESPNIETT